MNLNRSQINNILHLIGWVTTLYMIFLWSPIDTSVGLTQKIFYFHVPVGWLGMLAIFGVGITSIMFLITKDYKWDEEICDLMNIPIKMLPKVLDSADFFGEVDKDIFGSSIPILGVAGDQQAATIGQACFNPGMIKSTYGTGCFSLLNTGSDFVKSNNNMLTTIAYRINNKIIK